MTESTTALATLSLGVLGAAAPDGSAQALLAALPEVGAHTQITLETLCVLPAASLDFKLLLRVLLWAREQIGQGNQAIILVVARDSLEECAYFLDLLWDLPAPLLLTDGVANLAAALTVGLAEHSRRRGVLVVIDGHIHSALHLRTPQLPCAESFTATAGGPVGMLLGGRCHYFRPPAARRPLPMPLFIDHRVALLEAALAADTELLEQLLPLGYSGLVVAGHGGGCISAAWAGCLRDISRQIPVVIAARNGQGTAQAHSHCPVHGCGAWLAGELSPRKARVRLWLLIAAGIDLTQRADDAFWQ